MNSASAPDQRRKREKGELADETGVRTAPDWKPQCVYFYYLKPTSYHHAEVFALLEDKRRDIEEDELPYIVKDLVGRVRSGICSPIGWAIGDVRWRRRSYLVIVVDDKDWTLSKANIELKTRSSDSRSDHTFKNRKVIRPFDNVTGLRFVNHIAKKGDTWDGRTPEEFKITLGFRNRNPAISEPITHDDSGANLGPPIEP